jgi:hypothetical protein
MIMKELQRSATLHSSEIAEKVTIAKSQMTHSIDRLITWAWSAGGQIPRTGERSISG